MITTPSGRQFSFPDVKRRMKGSVSFFTQIKNYPVQSFATADIVPLVLLKLQQRMDEQNLKSLIVNTVHDSIVIDVHPDEEEKILSSISEVRNHISNSIQMQWGIDMNVPMELDAKIGSNWLDTKEVDLHC